MTIGLVLAGGEGSRLARQGITTPKAVVPVGGRPLLAWAVAGLRLAGASAVTVALRTETAEWIRTHTVALPANLATVVCQTPSSLHTLVEALQVLPRGPVLVSMVDTLMDDTSWRDAGRTMRADLDAGAEAVVLATPAGDDESPLHVAIDAHRRVTAFPDQAAAGLVTAGAYLLSDRARDHAEATLAAGTARMRGFLRSLVSAGHAVTAVTVATAFDLDRAADLRQAEAWLAGHRSSP